MKKSGVAKVHDEVTEAKNKFTPSTGDEDYLKMNPLALPDEDRIGHLFDLADDINTGYITAIGIAQKATARMIDVGADLLKARTYFTGDLEFGRWRKENIDFSQSHCARLMQVSREFNGQQDALGLPISTLSELCSASPVIKEKVLADTKAGNKPTAKQVKEAKKADKVPPSSPDKVQKVKEEPIVKSIMTPPVETPEERADKWLALPVVERISGLEVRGKHAEPMVDAFLMFGIPPFHEGLPSIDTIHFLWHAIGTAITDRPELTDKFTVAYDYLLELY